MIINSKQRDEFVVETILSDVQALAAHQELCQPVAKLSYMPIIGERNWPRA